MSSPTSSPSVSIYTQGGGTASSSQFPSNPVRSTRDPASSDIKGQFGQYPIGQQWINSSSGSVFELTSFSPSNGVITATWTSLGGGTAAVSALSGNTGTANPVGGVIGVVGVTNQITTTGSGSNISVGLPSNIVAPGSLTTTGTMTVGLGALTITEGELQFLTTASKILFAAGSGACFGVTSAMSGSPGAVTVLTDACSPSCNILYCRNITGGTPGHVSVTAQTTGTFTLTSTEDETSTFTYWIFNE